MSQNPFFRSSDSQTFMSHSFIPALIYGLKVLYGILILIISFIFQYFLICFSIRSTDLLFVSECILHRLLLASYLLIYYYYYNITGLRQMKLTYTILSFIFPFLGWCQPVLLHINTPSITPRTERVNRDCFMCWWLCIVYLFLIRLHHSTIFLLFIILFIYLSIFM